MLRIRGRDGARPSDEDSSAELDSCHGGGQRSGEQFVAYSPGIGAVGAIDSDVMDANVGSAGPSHFASRRVDSQRPGSEFIVG